MLDTAGVQPEKIGDSTGKVEHLTNLYFRRTTALWRAFSVLKPSGRRISSLFCPDRPTKTNNSNSMRLLKLSESIRELSPRQGRTLKKSNSAQNFYLSASSVPSSVKLSG